MTTVKLGHALRKALYKYQHLESFKSFFLQSLSSACTRSSVTTILTDGDHCAGSQTLSSRWSSMNVKIIYRQLDHLVAGQLGFGGRVRARPPRAGGGLEVDGCAPRMRASWAPSKRSVPLLYTTSILGTHFRRIITFLPFSGLRALSTPRRRPTDDGAAH